MPSFYDIRQWNEACAWMRRALCSSPIKVLLELILLGIVMLWVRFQRAGDCSDRTQVDNALKNGGMKDDR